MTAPVSDPVAVVATPVPEGLADEDGVRFAVRATGLLAKFNVAGVLAPADVAVARRLSRLGHEPDDTVLLAVALTVRALRAGSVCLDLERVAEDRAVLGRDDAVVDTSTLPWPEPASWLAACAASPLTGPGGPLRLAGPLFYLDRYFRQEEQVRLDLAGRSAATQPTVDTGALRAALDRLFPEAGADDRQRQACAVGALRWASVIAGGPGTGKTTTIARLLAVLRDHDPGLRIALVAPTGKAAARMQEAIAAEDLPPDDRARVDAPAASTIHRLLVRRPDSTSRFQYHAGRHLPYDVVVVDETSMVSLTLMARLLEAVRSDARLVLVGDPDQLASVEAGAVLGDVVNSPTAPDPTLAAALDAAGCTGAAGAQTVTRLDRNHRNNPAIAGLAAAVREGHADDAVAALRAGDPSLVFVETAALEDREPAGLDELRTGVVDAARRTREAAEAGDTVAALAALEEHRLLCAHRRGPYGVTRWAGQVERWLDEAGVGGVGAGPGAEWYPGRPLLITGNDYDLGLYNGDTGVVVDTGYGLRAVFSRGDTAVEKAPALLDQVQTVHAMTVHRAQGGQFDEITVVLPPPDSPLLTRELLYTAITRARRRVRVVGSADAVAAAVGRPINRASGFARRAGSGPE